MALVPCPECDRYISDKARFCPHCGYPMEDEIEEAEAVEEEEEGVEEAEAAEDEEDREPGFIDAILDTPPPSTRLKSNNALALLGFVLGICSVFLYQIGVLPILGIVVSAAGLARFDPKTQKNRWMAGVGLGLSIAYTFAYLYAYGHLR